MSSSPPPIPRRHRFPVRGANLLVIILGTVAGLVAVGSTVLALSAYLRLEHTVDRLERAVDARDVVAGCERDKRRSNANARGWRMAATIVAAAGELDAPDVVTPAVGILSDVAAELEELGAIDCPRAYHAAAAAAAQATE